MDPLRLKYSTGGADSSAAKNSRADSSAVQKPPQFGSDGGFVAGPGGLVAGRPNPLALPQNHRHLRIEEASELLNYPRTNFSRLNYLRPLYLPSVFRKCKVLGKPCRISRFSLVLLIICQIP